MEEGWGRREGYEEGMAQEWWLQHFFLMQPSAATFQVLLYTSLLDER